MQIVEICVQSYSSKPVVISKLEQNGYVFKDNFYVYDNYYTHFLKDVVRKIDYATLVANTVLLRTKKQSNIQTHYLIFKNKTINSKNEVIKEETVQTRIENMEEAKRIFSLSGFNNWSRVIIEETEYVKGNITITIQDVQGLGLFLEIEENKQTPGDSETKFNELIYIANSLGLDLGKDYSCKKNYLLLKKENMR